MAQHTFPDTDNAETEHWMKERKAHLARCDMDDIQDAVGHLNLTSSGLNPRQLTHKQLKLSICC